MLEPWPEFSRLIYDICDHRIENSPEINGSINNSYISLDEHLLMFFCLNDRKVSTREEIEYELLKFLYSLKYYSVRWPRARLFAQMLGFLKEGSKNFFAGSGQKNMSEVPNQYNVPAQFLRHQEELDGHLEDTEIPYNDVYLQEFYFYAFSFLSKDRKGMKPARKGQMMIKLNTEQRTTTKIMNWIYFEREHLKSVNDDWNKRIREITTKEKLNPLDE